MTEIFTDSYPERATLRLDNRSAAAGDLSIVAGHVADCIGNVIPHPIAILVPGETPRTYSPSNFPTNALTQIQVRFEENAQLFPDLMQASDRLSTPHRFSDGSRAFLIPLVHNGNLEAVLCLYDSGKRDQELLHQHLVALAPICRLAAISISRTRQSETEAQTIPGRNAGASKGNPQTTTQLVSSLLRAVSHDIRTPITTIRGFAKMMLDGRTGPVSDSQRECLHMAMNGVDQLIGLAASVNGASDLIEQIRAEVLDFHELCQTAIKAARPLLVEKAVTVEEDIDMERGAIYGDRRALANVVEQLLACVIRNVEYRGKLRVEIRCRNATTLMLALPGALSLPVAEEDLAAVREIVFLHGGQLAVRPGRNGGQALTLTLPGYIQ